MAMAAPPAPPCAATRSRDSARGGLAGPRRGGGFCGGSSRGQRMVAVVRSLDATPGRPRVTTARRARGWHKEATAARQIRPRTARGLLRIVGMRVAGGAGGGSEDSRPARGPTSGPLAAVARSAPAPVTARRAPASAWSPPASDADMLVEPLVDVGLRGSPRPDPGQSTARRRPRPDRRSPDLAARRSSRRSHGSSRRQCAVFELSEQVGVDAGDITLEAATDLAVDLARGVAAVDVVAGERARDVAWRRGSSGGPSTG